MKEFIVTSQNELDNIDNRHIEENDIIKITDIKSESIDIRKSYNCKIIIKTSFKIISVYKKNEIYIHGNNCIFSVDGSSIIYAYDNNTVEATSKSIVYAFNKTNIKSYDKSIVYAYNNCEVEAFDDSIIYAFDNSTIHLNNNSYSVAFNNKCDIGIVCNSSEKIKKKTKSRIVYIGDITKTYIK